MNGAGLWGHSINQFSCVIRYWSSHLTRATTHTLTLDQPYLTYRQPLPMLSLAAFLTSGVFLQRQTRHSTKPSPLGKELVDGPSPKLARPENEVIQWHGIYYVSNEDLR
jgi:hypothetical protein